MLVVAGVDVVAVWEVIPEKDDLEPEVNVDVGREDMVGLVLVFPTLTQ